MEDVQQEAARLVGEFWQQANHPHGASLEYVDAGRKLLAGSNELKIMALLAAYERPGAWPYTVHIFLMGLLLLPLTFTGSELERLLTGTIALKNQWREYEWKAIIKHTRRFAKTQGLPPVVRERLAEMSDQLLSSRATTDQKLAVEVNQILGRRSAAMPSAGEVWADAVISEINAMCLEHQEAWGVIFAHASIAEGGKPGIKWLQEAEKNQEAVGEAEFLQSVVRWLNVTAAPVFNKPVPQETTAADLLVNPRAYDEYLQASKEYQAALQECHSRISEKNISILKGLAWYCAPLGDAELARGLGHMAEAAFTNVRERGAWAKSAGNAAIWSLGRMPNGVGVGPLARLRTRLRDRGALKLIASSIEAAAKNVGMTVDELEDLAVPTGSLDADGARRETFGADGSATLTLDAKNAKTNLQWFGTDGKPRKAVPAAVKANHAAEVKALKAAEAEIKGALTAQAARFDTFLLDEREWPYAQWRERYLSHPVLGNIARRLIWTVDGVPCLPAEGPLSGASASPSPRLGYWGKRRGSGEAPPDPPPSPVSGEVDRLAGPEGVPQTVRLWHPLGASPEDVLRWRQTLEARQIVQPFKQAHREVYLLTDAERRTNTYSNRFAAHILKQHQFNSLCVLRGWKNQLRLMVDDVYPPATRELPRHNLRAEFWVEGIGDDYGTDTNDAGTYLRLVTDQVRFYPLDTPTNYAHAGGGGYTGTNWRQGPAEALPLDQVPPLAFSEVMRDVDLFVGVASVGNDPAWVDGGPQGRHVQYWRDYAFGDLTETARTRADVLARLLPRLKIADRCRLDGKFLVVRGDLRTYKIHLGSGNILMDPNDQYLCIVPGSRAEDAGDLFLPFEGDRTLAVVLSKAFLLAADTKITDPTITPQIRKH